MMKATLYLFFLFILFQACGSTAAPSENIDRQNIEVFEVINPDFNLSPSTGMFRKHWIDAASYLLNGAFSYIEDLDDAMRFPKQEGGSYPQDGKWNKTENLEGLCRTMFIAAPLLKEQPELVLNNIKVADYYRHQLRSMIDPESRNYIIPHRTGGPSQTLVEFGGLAVSLTIMPEIIWEPLSQDEKDALAELMLSYGNGPTIGSNWRFFNIFVMSFFKDKGYEVNDENLQKLLQECLAAYRGYGWYNDSPAYDYYSMWAFQMYGMIWAHYYGDKFNAQAGDQFTSNFRDLIPNYPYMFSKDGLMNMYGRSMCYRMASIIPFPLMGWLEDDSINYGWMRKIASRTILQFLQNPQMMDQRVPTLGFYGPFEPAVQIYSCRGSVYWMGKAFLGLLVPEDNLFWTQQENDGPWADDLIPGKAYNKFMSGSNILITNYPNSGASEIRAWCHEKVANDWQKFRATENYNKLAYNTEFPWMADGRGGEVSMNYAVKNVYDKWEVLRLYTFKKFEDGIYYRDAVLETNEDIVFRLADIPLANGILRVDKVTLPVETTVRHGHYSLPEIDGEIRESIIKNDDMEIYCLDNGTYQTALVTLLGSDSMEFVETVGLHPVSDKCKVINARSDFQGDRFYLTLQLWKKSGEPFTPEELNPVSSYRIQNDNVEITFSDGSVKTVKF